ncbi:MAG: class I SAM-dependent methyltransferase [Desulfobacterales bacterium]|jgi:SAM-dependent methyltransferase|nr:class I SAM-dependent methyltransferase [Desulfobacterales bacterium]
MMRCTRCKLIFVVPQWTDPLAENIFHTYDGWPAGLSGGAADRRGIMQGIARSLLARKPDGGRLIDVGCANGMFFDVLRSESASTARRQAPIAGERGRSPQPLWRFYGVEPDPRWQGVFQPEITIRAQPLRSCHFPGNFFDVVTLLDALYYLPEPDKELAEIARILKVDGLFVFDIPGQWYLRMRGIIGRFFRLQRTRPFTAYPFYFSPFSLKHLIQNAGLEVIVTEVGRGALQSERLFRTLLSGYIAAVKAVCRLGPGWPPYIAPMPVYYVQRRDRNRL